MALAFMGTRAKPPETVDVDYQRLRTLMARYMPKSKKSIPIISSEWGYPIETAVSQGGTASTPRAAIPHQQHERNTP